MPLGSFVNAVPNAVFLAIHLVAFLVGATLAWRSFNAGARLIGWGFALFALAEVSYMTYHLDWTVFLFAHTVSEVLDLLAFVAIFIGLGSRVVAPAEARA